MKIELVSLAPWKTFTAGEDSPDDSPARELGAAVFLEEVTDRADFFKVMSRLRGQGDEYVYRVIAWDGSDEQRWFLELASQAQGMDLVKP